jgi:hypothetical protein
VAAIAIAGALVSWLHPWQGITLLVLVPVAMVWARRFDRWRVVVLPLLATALPLIYYLALSRTDSAWHRVSQPNHFAHFGSWLYLTLVPFALLAAPGWLGRNLDLQQRIVRLWPLVAFAEYLALHSSWIYHAFVGVSLPLAILAVNGWGRLGAAGRWLSPRLRPVLALSIVALVTGPGTIYYLQRLHREAAQHFVVAPEASALRYLARAGSGGVLAREPLGTTVPAFTDQRTWVGHPTWTPNYGARVAAAEALFSGRLSAYPFLAKWVVRTSGARFLLADCQARADLIKLLGSMLTSARHFGCATVYEVASPGRPS